MINDDTFKSGQSILQWARKKSFFFYFYFIFLLYIRSALFFSIFLENCMHDLNKERKNVFLSKIRFSIIETQRPFFFFFFFVSFWRKIHVGTLRKKKKKESLPLCWKREILFRRATPSFRRIHPKRITSIFRMKGCLDDIIVFFLRMKNDYDAF